MAKATRVFMMLLLVSKTAWALPNPAYDKKRLLTLAIKFVEFARGGRPVLTRQQAGTIVEGINSVYSQCQVRMRLEDYEQVDPARYGLDLRISHPEEMDTIRTPFDNDRYLVVIHTDAWNHGPMGPANAWTAMPGQVPAGAVLEAPVARNSNITAHEIGHYLGLDHADNVAELMNPIIYRNSVRITPAQCQTMRTTAVASRAGALRES